MVIESSRQDIDDLVGRANHDGWQLCNEDQLAMMADLKLPRQTKGKVFQSYNKLK